MRQLIVNTPQGKQEMIKVGKGGGYFDSSRVVWDEQEDGPLPEGVEPGKLVRTDRGLEEDLSFTPPRENITARQLGREINAKRSELIYTDISVDFPKGTAVIQYRDDKDHNAITSVIQGAMAHVLAGNPAKIVTFITKDNVQQKLRADAMVQIGLAALEEKQAIYIAARDKKDVLDGLTQAELNHYDVDAGWEQVLFAAPSQS